MVDLIPVEKIKALEYVFPNHLKNLSNIIKKDNTMKYPLIVERDHNIVLDGSHRHVFLLMEGYRLAPVHYVDYMDEHIAVGTHRMHRLIINGPVNISKQEVIERGTSGNWFPPRTTRHFFPFLRVECDIPLSNLQKENTRNVEHHIANANICDEIDHNKHYIKEIEEETDEVIRYLEESRRTRKYLLQQIEIMEGKIDDFLG